MEDHRLSGSDWTLLVFNGLLVLVGAAQALYVAKTLGAIKIQATHMEKQVSLQRAGMKQWVELDDWSNGLDGSVGSYTLMVRFSLLNSTGFYLTISHAELEFETQPSVTAFLVRYGTPLPPNKPIPMTIRLAIDDTKQQAWLRGVLGFGIKGKIVFISALEEEVTQNISGLVTCSYSQGANLESVVKLKIGNQKLA